MSQDQVQSDQDKSKEQQQQQQDGKEFEPKTPDQNDVEKVNQNEKEEKNNNIINLFFLNDGLVERITILLPVYKIKRNILNMSFIIIIFYFCFCLYFI